MRKRETGWGQTRVGKKKGTSLYLDVDCVIWAISIASHAVPGPAGHP